MATTTISHSITAVGIDDQPTVAFNFIADLERYKDEKLYEIWRETEPGVPKSNCEFKEYSGIRLHNMRAADVKFDFDTTGFKAINVPSKVGLKGKDCAQDEDGALLNAYLEECIQVVKEQFKSDEIICFDWRVSMSAHESCLSD